MRFFKHLASRCFVFVAGLLVAVLLAECMLLSLCALKGCIKPRSAKTQSPRVVLCIGRSFYKPDSQVFGRLLEKHLNTNGTARYKVVNRVLPWFKSPLDSVYFLERYLAESKPYGVVFCDQASVGLRTFKYSKSGFSPPWYHASSICKIIYGLLKKHSNSTVPADPGKDVSGRFSSDLNNTPEQKLSPAMEKLRSQGFYLIDMNDYKGAESVFSQLVRDYPDSIIGFEGLARVYSHTGRTSEAVLLFEQIIKRWPANSCQYMKFAVLADTKFPQKAQKSFEKFFELEPREPTMKNRYADWLRRMGERQKAVTFALNLIDAGLGTAKTYEILALCYAGIDGVRAKTFAAKARSYALDMFCPLQRNYLRGIVGVCRENEVPVFVDVQPNFIGYKPFLKLLGYPLGLRVVSLRGEFEEDPESCSKLFTDSYESLNLSGVEVLAVKTANVLES